MKAPIQIRREDVANDIRALAELMKVSITDAVAEAVRLKLVEEKAKVEAARLEKRKRVRQLVEEFRSLPNVGPMLTDADLYDEDGLPKSL
jgi:antitoxin VapB